MSRTKTGTSFRNPLLQPTTDGIPTLPSSSSEPELTSPAPVPQAKHHSEFEANHERLTVWVESAIKARFEMLCQTRGRGAKTQLINEALADLLKKHKIAS